MEKVKIDRRVRRTKAILLQSLISLMSEKKINKITVKELTDLADVNRSTFYLYYQDLFDMLEKVEMELFDDFRGNYEAFLHESRTYDTFLNFFEYVFHFAEENADLFKILLGPNGDYSFVEKFKNAIINAQPKVGLEQTEIEMHLFRAFIVSVFIGVIQKWLEEEKKTSAVEMSQIMLKLIFKGLKSDEWMTN